MDTVVLGRTGLRVSVMGLVGTGSTDHLEANARYLSRAPLPAAVHARASAQFGDVDFLSCN